MIFLSWFCWLFCCERVPVAVHGLRYLAPVAIGGFSFRLVVWPAVPQTCDILVTAIGSVGADVQLKYCDGFVSVGHSLPIELGSMDAVYVLDQGFMDLKRASSATFVANCEIVSV